MQEVKEVSRLIVIIGSSSVICNWGNFKYNIFTPFMYCFMLISVELSEFQKFSGILLFILEWEFWIRINKNFREIFDLAFIHN